MHHVFICRKVSWGFLNFLFAYVFLLVAFILSFSILFRNQPAFQTPLGAFVKVNLIKISNVFHVLV